MDRLLRELVWQRAASRCEYCRIPQVYDALPFEIDHVIAEKHRGQTVESNLALSCFSCNVHKGPNIAGVDPDTGMLTALYHPRTQDWSEHFAWQGAVLLGSTDVGRTTIEVLRINLVRRVGHRRELLDAGLLRW